MNSILSYFVTFLVLQTVISENVKDNGNNTVNEFHEENEGSRALSRRKRFVIFPDGSSLQLVFCCQTAALIPIGDIFLFGSTVGLAWNLPTDPSIFHTFKDFERPLRRSDVVKTINYLDEDGRLIAKVPYKRRLIVNPAFSKRSVEDKSMSYKEKLKLKIDRKKMHEKHFKLDYLKHHNLDKNSIDFHRRNRVELYGKIEKMLEAMGRDGRQCVLYKLCEAAQRHTQQGTFVQEFLRAVFTLPKGEEFQRDEHKDYDKAHVETENCSELYPGLFLIQTPVLIPIGDIFLFGDSAGLAWLLPTDPNIFYTLKEYERPLRRSDVVKTINYLDEKGRLIAKVPYERRLKLSPVIAKRSLKDNKKKSKPKLDRRKMHEKHLKKEQLKAHHLDKSSLEFHRSKRVELYQKIEKLLSTMGRDGRQCVLYKLCESAQRASKQGTFLQEFLRAVFTLPKGKEFHHDDHKEYDNAHVETDDCATRYPGCEDMHESILL
nr:uncharacterized protein LOC126055746 [Helicoverpa armigera]